MNKSQRRESSFESLLLKTIDEELSRLGSSSKQAFYYYLEREFNINFRDIPHKFEAFAKAIEQIFGPGARFLEIQIMESLYKKIGPFKYLPGKGKLMLTEYVSAANVLCSRGGSQPEIAKGL